MATSATKPYVRKPKSNKHTNLWSKLRAAIKRRRLVTENRSEYFEARTEFRKLKEESRQAKLEDFLSDLARNPDSTQPH